MINIIKLILNAAMAYLLTYPFFKDNAYVMDVKLNELSQATNVIVHKTLERNTIQRLSGCGLDWMVVVELALLSISTVSTLVLFFKSDNTMIKHISTGCFILSIIGFALLVGIAYTQSPRY